MRGRARRRQKKELQKLLKATPENVFPVSLTLEGHMAGTPEEELIISLGASFALGFGVSLNKKDLVEMARLMTQELTNRNYGVVTFIRSHTGNIAIRGRDEAQTPVVERSAAVESMRNQLT